MYRLHYFLFKDIFIPVVSSSTVQHITVIRKEGILVYNVIYVASVTLSYMFNTYSNMNHVM